MSPPIGRDELRRRAEETLTRQQVVGRGAREGDLERLCHELDVHGVELELQNEELRRSHVELEAARDRYFQLYEQAPVGYLTLDAAGTIVEANLRAAALLGTEAGRLVGSALGRWVSSDQAVVLARHLRDVFATTDRRACELVLLGPGGARRHALVESVAVGAAPGRADRCRTVLVDVTSLREAEHARREAEELLQRREDELWHLQRLETVGQLAPRLAHEYQNLLMAIGGTLREAAEEAERCPAAPCPTRPSLERMRSEVGRGTELAAQVLAFSRKQEHARFPLRVDEQVAGLERTLRSLLRDGAVEVVVTRGAPQAWVLAGRGWIEQVLLNLALNARDAMPRGGRLEVATRPAPLSGQGDDGVALLVKDTGLGMSPEVQARAFEPFFTTKAEREGTGLGLSTVRDLVGRMGGRVTLRSAPGEGSAFEVLLPCTQPTRISSERFTPVAFPPPSQPPAPDRRWTVLVVEDDRLVLRTVEHYLRRAGHEPLLALDPGEALELLAAQQGPVDLLLTDVLLSQGSGQDLARAVRARHPSLAVLYMSALPREELVAQGRIAPDSAAIEKPFTEQQLARSMSEVLQGRRG